MVTRVYCVCLTALAMSAFCMSAETNMMAMMDGDQMAVFVSGQVTVVDATSATVLGLKINLPTTNGSGHMSREETTQTEARMSCCGGGGVGTSTTPPAVGDWVRIHLAGDAAPLSAFDVQTIGGYDSYSQIHANVQAVDTAAKTVTLLGVKIDVSTATIEGNNADASQAMPLLLADVTVGQRVAVRLDSAKLPALVATKVVVMDAMNQVNVKCADQKGNMMNSLDGNMTVEVMQMVNKIDPASGKTYKRKVVTVQTTTQSGTFSLRGLVPGKAKVVYTLNGKKRATTIIVAANGTTTLTLKIKR